MVYVLLAGLAVIIAGFFLLPRISRSRKQKRREALATRPFPAPWSDILCQRFPLYSQLPKELQSRLEGFIHIFLDEKVFLGRGGMVINDEVRLLISAQACLLILNKTTDFYPNFRTILVYPDVYQAKALEHQHGVVSQHRQLRAGESWHRGPVVVAWRSVVDGAEDPQDGANVVFHEFSHKLDEEDSVMDGTPVLQSRKQYSDWVHAFSEEYEQLVDQVSQQRPHDIDAYGATSPAEFFAVVTEAFFEQPQQMSVHHPQLYRQLRDFYSLDPLGWH